MSMNKWLSALAGGLLILSCTDVPSPAPFGAVPSQGQLDWHKREMLMFYHYGQASFSGCDGENPSCKGEPWSEGLLLANYQPEVIDADQWVKTAADNGFGEVILTAKHHDGFCLWDNPESTADIANPACANATDVVQAVRDACNRYGVALGLYLSPWDRMIEAEEVETSVYEARYKKSLQDLMTRYAPVVEFWFDGNHAGSFDWEAVNRAVLEINPQCVIFSNGGPGCRWVGNEEGVAGQTNWNTLDIEGRELRPSHMTGDYRTFLAEGDRGAASWCPAECDFSIQQIGDMNGWFYGPDDARKTPQQLMDLYYKSVGRGGVFLMNVPPSPRGILEPEEVAVIEAFTAMREAVFGNNLALEARAAASAVRGKAFGPERMLDGNYDTYFATPDDVTEVTLEFTLDGPRTFNRVLLQEYIPLGQRVEAFSVQVRSGEEWTDWSRGTTIGFKRILQGPEITADAVRIRIEKSLACPVLNGFGLYLDNVSGL